MAQNREKPHPRFGAGVIFEKEADPTQRAWLPFLDVFRTRMMAAERHFGAFAG